MSNIEEFFFYQNLIKINKLIEKVLLITLSVPILFILMTIIGLWEVNHSFSFFMICYIIVTYTLTRFVNSYKNFPKLGMYIGIFSCIGFILLLSLENIIEVTIVYGLIPFLTCLYYNKKVTIITTIISFFVMIISLCIKSNNIIENLIKWQYINFSDKDWLISNIIGFSIQYVFVFFISLLISNRAHNSLEEIVHSNQKAEELNILLQSQNEELHSTQTKIIHFVAEVLGSHDHFTGLHVIHTKVYVKIIANQLRKNGHYLDYLSDELIDIYQTAAFLHDIGKIHIPEGILNKPGKFTNEEFKLMQCHPEEGKKLLEFLPIIDNGIFNNIAMEMANFHHEKWDGSGYPKGLKEYEIPLCARIMAAADVLDALISRRLYKEPMSVEAAMYIFKKSKGSHFEPCIAQAVLDSEDEIKKLDAMFKSQEEESNTQAVEWWKQYQDSLEKSNKM